MLSLGCLFGCGYEDESFETVDMPLHSIDIIVSKQRPANVRITAIGFAGGCDKNPKIYYERDGNTISLWATMDTCVGCMCPTLVFDLQGEVTVAGLDIGTYKVVAAGNELMTFSITDIESFVKKIKQKGPLMKRMPIFSEVIVYE